MLQEAVRLDSEGSLVFVVTNFEDDHRAVADDMKPGHGIEFLRILPIGFDWLSMRNRHDHKKTVYLFDHDWICRSPCFSRMLEAATAFDAVEEPQDATP
jgi:hypothetical protein